MSQSYILAVPGYAHAPFTSTFKRRLFAWTLWIYLPYLKFVALRSVPEIIGNTLKISEVPGYANAAFFTNFKGSFVRMDAVNIHAKFELRSFTRSGDNREYWENLGRPWILPRSLISQIFKRLLLGWTPWIQLPNLKFVALRLPEIIWGILKNWEVPGYAHAPFSPKFLNGFCSYVRCEYTCQI